MRKVCVVTLYRHNYGAFLQAYGLQRFLENLGYDATLLNYDYFKDHAILGISLSKIKHPVSFVKSITYRLLRYRVSKDRDRIIGNSAVEHLKETDYYRTYKSVRNNPPAADIYITGSDQVWNPTISEQGFMSRLLEFVPDGNNVLCSYAASVGVKEFREEIKKEIRMNLNRYDRISVREPASAEMIRDLTDKVISLHKDPALLLTTEQWDKFQVKVETNRPYVFIYLAQNDPDLIEHTIKIARKHNWDVVDCHGSVNYHIKDCANGNRILSPMEFVGGIKNAEYVVTNSFHCLVFTIHYKKKAYIKRPPKGAGRLSELIDNMSLERITQKELINDNELNDIYSKTEVYLANERIKAEAYFHELNVILDNKEAR